ncbi:hypothetical protein L2E82_32257 [Cichorium intybus]|uniref:Uncharacterized protein n=1 Tax=Cichorium intybus TaxID=13427 RepID=A0ACB9BG96_CICIN|nr:hypothetical protein L2E82_32257 [Cichorium intybus]
MRNPNKTPDCDRSTSAAVRVFHPLLLGFWSDEGSGPIRALLLSIRSSPPPIFLTVLHNHPSSTTVTLLRTLHQCYASTNSTTPSPDTNNLPHTRHVGFDKNECFLIDVVHDGQRKG